MSRVSDAATEYNTVNKPMQYFKPYWYVIYSNLYNIIPIIFTDSIKLCGGKILIHCYAGISRSATVCLAYLMKSRRMRLEEAFEFVRKVRAVISPNLGFMMQLSKYETELRQQQKERVDIVNLHQAPRNTRIASQQLSLGVSSAMEGISSKKVKLSRDFNLMSSSENAAAAAAVAARLTRSVSLPIGHGMNNNFISSNPKSSQGIVSGGQFGLRAPRHEPPQRFIFTFGMTPIMTAPSSSPFTNNWTMSTPQNSPSPICSPSWMMIHRPTSGQKRWACPVR